MNISSIVVQVKPEHYDELKKNWKLVVYVIIILGKRKRKDDRNRRGYRG